MRSANFIEIESDPLFHAETHVAAPPCCSSIALANLSASTSIMQTKDVIDANAPPKGQGQHVSGLLLGAGFLHPTSRMRGRFIWEMHDLSQFLSPRIVGRMRSRRCTARGQLDAVQRLWQARQLLCASGGRLD